MAGACRAVRHHRLGSGARQRRCRRCQQRTGYSVSPGGPAPGVPSAARDAECCRSPAQACGNHRRKFFEFCGFSQPDHRKLCTGAPYFRTGSRILQNILGPRSTFALRLQRGPWFLAGGLYHLSFVGLCCLNGAVSGRTIITLKKKRQSFESVHPQAFMSTRQ